MIRETRRIVEEGGRDIDPDRLDRLFLVMRVTWAKNPPWALHVDRDAANLGAHLLKGFRDGEELPDFVDPGQTLH